MSGSREWPVGLIAEIVVSPANVEGSTFVARRVGRGHVPFADPHWAALTDRWWFEDSAVVAVHPLRLVREGAAVPPGVGVVERYESAAGDDLALWERLAWAVRTTSARVPWWATALSTMIPELRTARAGSAGLRDRITGIDPKSYIDDPGFSVAISRVLAVLDEETGHRAGGPVGAVEVRAPVEEPAPSAPRDGLAGSDEVIEAILRLIPRQQYVIDPMDDLRRRDKALSIYRIAEPFIAARVRAEAVAEERQRLADAVLPDHWQTTETWGGVRRLVCGRCRHGDGLRFLWPCRTRRAITGEPEPEPDSTLVAAGSVPVATPAEPAAECPAGGYHAWVVVEDERRCLNCDAKEPLEAAAEPSAGAGTPAEEVSGGSGHAEQIAGVQAWMALDLWQALGRPTEAAPAPIFGEWAEMLAAVRGLTAEVARLTGALAVSEAERVEVFTEAASYRAAIEKVLKHCDANARTAVEAESRRSAAHYAGVIRAQLERVGISVAAALGDGA